MGASLDGGVQAQGQLPENSHKIDVFARLIEAMGMSRLIAVRPAALASLIAVAAAAALTSASGASAQTLLDGLLAPQGPGAGVCTCTAMEPPNDCTNGPQISEMRAAANEGRGQIRALCSRDWTSGCEEQYGWQACASAEAQAQKNEICDGVVEDWWSQQVQPQLNQVSAQCRAANEQFIEVCTTQIRPQECVSCENMVAELDAMQAEIGEKRGWINRMRSGEVVLTPDDEVLIGQRVEELGRLERSYTERQNAYAMLRDTEFCPAT